MAKFLNKLMQGASELSPTCRQATRLQSLALERPLSLRERVGLKIHLVLCRWCKRYGIQIRFLRSVAQKQSDHEQTLPVAALSPEARERMKQQLKSPGPPASDN
jgi:hypothetical protein